jgi:hypothetical protein
MSKARDLANAGTALGAVDATELGYLDGVTSAVQTQLNAKQAVVSGVDNTEIGYLDGVTSAIQTQINAQIPKSTVTTKGDILVATGASTVVRQGVGTDGQVLTANSAQADGVEWTTLTTLPSQTGNSGKFLTTDGSAASWGSPITKWTRRASGIQTFSQIAYNGTNLWVAVGNAGKLYSSPDGITWTSRTSQFGADNINDVFFGNGLWVAVGSAGKISTSTDGTTWTARTANMSTNAINAVTYANSLWVAVGNGGGTTNTGGITYSSDGVTWTRKSQNLTVGANYQCVVWNGTNWVVGSTVSTNNYLYATTPSGTWTAGYDNVGNNITQIFWDGTRTLYSVSPYQWNYSTNTAIGTPSVYTDTTPGAAGKGKVKLYNGNIYIGTGQGHISGFVPSSTAYPENLPIINAGGTHINDSGSGFVQQGGVEALWVGAQGFIMTNSRGDIYTSF